jgi:hypothetical protein
VPAAARSSSSAASGPRIANLIRAWSFIEPSQKRVSVYRYRNYRLTNPRRVRL